MACREEGRAEGGEYFDHNFLSLSTVSVLSYWQLLQMDVHIVMAQQKATM